jgi:DNA adenine methylase
MNPTQSVRPQARRLIHYTPLRYPGGKGKLASYIKRILEENKLVDGEYAEPYAGGAAIALELLFHEYVSRIHINDLSRPVYAFWHSVLNETDRLCGLVRNTRLNLKSWDAQKRIFADQKNADNLALGFATFFLNRTNRSGILNGGIIGGRDQTGHWKIDARFNREELIYRIESIAKMRSKIHLSQMDALEFLQSRLPRLPNKTLIYLDPPYYVKGRELYYDFYQREDHEKVAKFVTGKLARKKWIVSYDNVPATRELYRGYEQLVYGLGYSARNAREGTEVIFFGETLEVCPLIGPFRLIRGGTKKEKEPMHSERLARRKPRMKKSPSRTAAHARQRRRQHARPR